MTTGETTAFERDPSQQMIKGPHQDWQKRDSLPKTPPLVQ